MRSYEIVYDLKEYALSDAIALPHDIVRFTSDESDVFVSPEKASYIVTDTPSATRAVLALARGLTLQETLESLIGAGISRSDAVRSMHDVLAQVEMSGFLQSAQPVEDVAGPLSLECYLTFRCNLRCTHCYVAAGPDVHDADELAPDQWRGVLAAYAQFADAKVTNKRVTFTGGEPLMRADFFQLSQFVKSLGMTSELFSKATLIRSERMADQIAGCIDVVQLSIDGATAAVHDRIRGDGAFDRAIRALRWLTTRGVRCRMAITVMPQNVRDLEEHLVELLASVGTPRVEVRLALAMVRGRASGNMRFADSIEGERVLTRLLSVLYDSGIRKPQPVQTNFRGVSCGYGRMLAVAPNGTTYGCALTTMPIGSVKHESFESLARRAADLGKATEIQHIDGCSDCELRHFCSGLCRLNNVAYTGSLFKSACGGARRQEVLRRLVSRRKHGISPVGAVGSFWR